MPMPTLDEVRSSLASFGSPIDNFNQKDPGRAFKRQDLKEGYCEGVCLDWIRRVLQGGRPSFSPRPIAGSNAQQNFKLKMQSQAARQAHAFLNWKPMKEKWQTRGGPRIKQGYVDQWNQNKSNLIEELHDLDTALYGLLNGIPASQTNIALTPTIQATIKKFFRLNLGTTEDATEMAKLYSQIPAKEAEIDAKKPDRDQILAKTREDVRQRAWKSFSTDSAKYFKKKRSFNNISLLSSEPLQTNLDISSVLAKLEDVGTNDIKISRAVKINIGGKQGSETFFHSTASYLAPGLEKPYLFLDPNYGIFAYAEWRDVRKAVGYLYVKVYSWIQGNPDREVPITNYTMQVEVFSGTT
jgi:hypothetical protein